MSKWLEIRYYAGGNPTKTPKRLRRRHLFRSTLFNGWEHSDCGLHVVTSRLVESSADKCKNCLRGKR